jgi:hydroxypyruvate reductase
LSLREAARSVFDAALRAADVHPLVRRALAEVQPTARGRVLVVGAGKASGAMAAAAEGALGGRIADGLVVVKDGDLADTARVRLV